jgi:hypothetical protein
MYKSFQVFGCLSISGKRLLNLGALWCPGVGSVHVFYHLTYIPDIVWFYFVLHYPVVLTTHPNTCDHQLDPSTATGSRLCKGRCPTPALSIFHDP